MIISSVLRKDWIPNITSLENTLRDIEDFLNKLVKL